VSALDRFPLTARVPRLSLKMSVFEILVHESPWSGGVHFSDPPTYPVSTFDTDVALESIMFGTRNQDIWHQISSYLALVYTSCDPKHTSWEGAAASSPSWGSSGTGNGLEVASTLSLRLWEGEETTVQGPLPLSSLAVEVSASSSTPDTCKIQMSLQPGSCTRGGGTLYAVRIPISV